MLQEFTAVLLNEQGIEAAKLEQPNDGDECNRKGVVLIETDEIESVYPRCTLSFGRPTCRIHLKSGDYYTVFESVSQIKEKANKSKVVFN